MVRLGLSRDTLCISFRGKPQSCNSLMTLVETTYGPALGARPWRETEPNAIRALMPPPMASQ